MSALPPPASLSLVTAQGVPYASAEWQTPSQHAQLHLGDGGEWHGLSSMSQEEGPPQLPEMSSLPPMFPDDLFP